VHHEMKRSQQLIGLGGAVIGVGTGLWGAVRRTTGSVESSASVSGIVKRSRNCVSEGCFAQHPPRPRIVGGDSDNRAGLLHDRK